MAYDTKELTFLEGSLYIKKEKILIIGDVHLGYEDSLSKEGVFVPSTNLKTALANLKKIKIKPKLIIINGDLKHSFTSLSKTTKEEITEFLENLKKISENIILIKGNHDTFINMFIHKQNIPIKDFYETEKYFITHGHKFFETSKTLIIGHEHPSIGLRLGTTFEQYKCFLIGKNIIVMPSFTNISVGSNILKNNFLSPFLNKMLKENKNFILDWQVLIYEKNHFFMFSVRDLIGM